MLSGWEDPASAEDNIAWTRTLYDTMLPHLHRGIYVNGLTEDTAQPTTAAFRPETYQRLAALKERYDPTNFFRLNPNVKPMA